MKTILAILKAALTKFSKINMVNYVGIATLIITAWQGSNLIQPSTVLMLTGLATLLLKIWQSSKEMVSTGFSMDWSVWGAGLLGLVIGFADTVVGTDWMHTWFGDKANLIIMVYMALTIILRTGFTNQSLNTLASTKA